MTTAIDNTAECCDECLTSLAGVPVVVVKRHKWDADPANSVSRLCVECVTRACLNEYIEFV